MQVNYYNFLILAVLSVSEQCWPPGLNSFENQLPSELPEWIGELRWIGHQERHSRKLRTFCVALVHWTPRMFGPHTHKHMFHTKILEHSLIGSSPSGIDWLGQKVGNDAVASIVPWEMIEVSVFSFIGARMHKVRFIVSSGTPIAWICRSNSSVLQRSSAWNFRQHLCQFWVLRQGSIVLKN